MDCTVHGVAKSWTGLSDFQLIKLKITHYSNVDFFHTIDFEAHIRASCVFFHNCIVFNVSLQFNRSVMSDSLQPHELQHARPPCPSPTPRVHPNSCPLSR